MRPTSKLQCLLLSRCCLLFLILAFCLPLANALRAQSPLPDDFNPRVEGSVYSVVVQADGKILVGGSFTKVNIDKPRNFIARFNPDETLDGTFNPGAYGSSVRSLLLQADGKILVSGFFTNLAGQWRNNIGRLHPDGTLDNTFDPGANTQVDSLALQADGKILVGGLFTTLAGQPRERIGRLNEDGTLDTTFNPGANGRVFSLAVQADGKILVGGSFTTLGGQPRDRIARLNADGTLDDTFNPGASAAVFSLAVQADGKILLGGSFTNAGGQARDRMARLNADGTLDIDFNLAPGSDGSVITMAVQTDGKILVGGNFTTLGGQPRSRIARINADGTLDNNFNPGANSAVWSLSVQGDGKILAGGDFSNLGGQPRIRIARLNNTDSVTQTVNYDGATITWMRSGASPEVWRTTFEHSIDGLEWTFLGPGLRIPGGWELPGVSVPPGGTLRARGFAAGGNFNGSGSFVEGYYGRPILLSQPASTTNAAGTTASFRVMAGPDEAVGYQWRWNGVRLLNLGNTSGANGPILSLSNVFKVSEGDYSVVLSNRFGSVTSSVATLTVLDPRIVYAPYGASRELGTDQFFSATAAGTPPLRYQWYHDGAAIPGAAGVTTYTFLSLSNLSRADAGLYTVVFSNAYASVTSSPALLMVNAVTVDNTFDPGVDSGAIGTGFFDQMVVQPDGKILVGGNFRSLGGQLRDSIARLNADGTLDGTFDPGVRSVTLGVTFNGSVSSLALQTDGKILVAGGFNRLAGQIRTNIARLNADGTLDTGFNPGVSTGSALALQADGKILVGGSFTNLAGQARNNIGRLNADGTLDNTFNPGANQWVSSLAVQADGKILVSGFFTNMAGQPRNRIARLNTDGTLDLTFNPDANDYVRSMVVQADGKILVHGNFTMLSGQPRNRFARINADGTLDSTFDPAAVHSLFVDCLAVQADGKILVGGGNTLARQVSSSLSRLNPDGTLDYNFNPSLFPVAALAILADGKILVGGAVTNVVSVRPIVSRLHNTDPATQILSYDGATITWMRGGTCAEVWRTTFEHSSDGVTWASLGAGTRIPGGWQLTGVSVPPGGTLRARGHVAGDLHGSGWFVEDSIGPPMFLSQPVGRSIPIGSSADFHVGAGGTPPLSYQWYHDGAPVPGAVGPSLTLQNLSRSDAGLYTVVVNNAIGNVTSAPAVLTVYAPATPDSIFNPGISGGIVTEYFPHPFVNSLAVQTDGKILVGGNFALLGGQPRNFIGRLNPDGSIDDTFNPGAGHWVRTMAVQADGKILVGGSFATLSGQTRYQIGRLQSDGTLDNSFNPGVASDIFQNVFFTLVSAFAVQPDGKIVVGGYFAGLGGLTSRHARLHIGRLNVNGKLDGTFNPGANDQVRALAMQTNGMILVGGDFTILGRKARSHIGRLKANGAVDSAFNPGANATVSALAVQADGKILVGGSFTNLGGQTRVGIGRLNLNGTLDTNFNPRANNSVSSLAVQSDGKILVGGYFTTMAGQPRNRLARLNPDGSLDSTFNPGANDGVNCVAVQEDGNILVGGEFTTLGGQSRDYIGRLNNTEPATEAFGYAGSTITWMRGGTGPEVWRTTFEQTTNGLTWKSLGGGTRIAGGWQRTGVALPAGATVRARGYVTGGEDASAWFVEDYLGQPLFLTPPASRTNGATTTATFVVDVEGSGPLTYQWFKNGVALVDQGNTAGASLATLTLSNVLRPDEGAYSVVVSNGFGSVTSLAAALTVLNPMIVDHPVDAHRNAGEVVTFNAPASGTPAPSYQWYHDGAAVPGAVGPSLTLQGVSSADAGLYWVVASNPEGNVASKPALLSVNAATLDSNFNPGTGGGHDGAVRSLAVQTDGKILVGGDFTSLDGYSLDFLGRLETNGMLDTTFYPWPDWQVFTVVTQPDGKILVGGGFTGLGDQLRGGIGRLNADGSLDGAFNPRAGGGGGLPFEEGIAGTVVYAVAVQPDGKILVGGNFTTLNGRARSRIGRLNMDGTLDSAFNPGANGTLRSLAVQADGKILAGGNFTTLGGRTRSRLGRLNANGTLDSAFNPGANGAVRCLAVQADGRILVGGEFTTLGKQPRLRIARLNADGTLDSTFNPGANSDVYSVVVQQDGKILVGGSFTNLAGQTRYRIARLNVDGSMDNTLSPVVSGSLSSPVVSGSVHSIAVQADGKILLGGVFGGVAGQTRSYIARLNNTESGAQPAGFNGSGLITITASRRGSEGGVGRSSLEHAGGADMVTKEVMPAINLRVVRGGSTVILNWAGGHGPYQVQQSTDLSNPDSWQDVGGPVQTNSISLPIGTGALFLRVRGQ